MAAIVIVRSTRSFGSKAAAAAARLVAEMNTVKLCGYPLDDAAHAGI
jgi:hypothetical protein